MTRSNDYVQYAKQQDVNLTAYNFAQLPLLQVINLLWLTSQHHLKQSSIAYSDVVLKARHWPQGTSRPNFMALAPATMAMALASGPVSLALNV